MTARLSDRAAWYERAVSGAFARELADAYAQANAPGRYEGAGASTGLETASDAGAYGYGAHIADVCDYLTERGREIRRKPDLAKHDDVLFADAVRAILADAANPARGGSARLSLCDVAACVAYHFPWVTHPTTAQDASSARLEAEAAREAEIEGAREQGAFDVRADHSFATREGMERARARGVVIGRPRACNEARRFEIARRARRGESIRDIAGALNMKRATVGRIVKAMTAGDDARGRVVVARAVGDDFADSNDAGEDCPF